MSGEFKRVAAATDDVFVFEIEKEMTLLPFLLKALSHRSRNSIKSILARGQVTVDEYIVTQFNYVLYPGQTVTILKNQAAKRESTLIGLKILYEDEDLIVVQKDAGLLSVASKKERQMTAHQQLMHYVKDKHRMNKIYVVHRLDKETSGVMMFAKHKHVQQTLQNNWSDMVIERSYMALVEGRVKKEHGTITSWLRETKTHVVYSSHTPNDGLHAVTHFAREQGNDHYSLLNVKLETGRKNQIRVHMKDFGYPVVGDKKYGSTQNPIGRLGLHARSLAFMHPTTQKPMHFEVKTPPAFFIKSK